MADAYVVFCTVPDEDVAGRVARALIEERLAACVNITDPVRSVYWWRGKIEDHREILLVVKTRPALFDRLKARIAEIHPYEVPEVVAMRVEAGAEKYLAWVTAETKP